MLFLMRKLLILVSVIASLFLSACSQDPIVNRLPWVYHIEIQQGNVITQEKVNQLRPGMTMRQVQFVLGAPMLVDPFHAERWDYYYELITGNGEEKVTKRVSLIFEEGRLASVNGTMRPIHDPNAVAVSNQITVEVPPQNREAVGILTKFWRWIGFGNDSV